MLPDMSIQWCRPLMLILPWCSSVGLFVGIKDKNLSQLLARLSWSSNDTGDAMWGDGVASEPELLVDLERDTLGCLLLSADDG